VTADFPHRRRNPLTGEWVLVSPHRAQRPWQGQVDRLPPEALPAYDPTCYLCPGNVRAGGVRNPDYAGTFVFDNDFAALRPEVPAAGPTTPSPLLAYAPEAGLCRVICFSPRHDLTLPEMPQAAVEQVVATWIAQTHDLSRRDFVRYVQVFENKGAQMGASNPHPHSQVWAAGRVPNEPAKELAAQAAYQAEHGTCLLCTYLQVEQAAAVRIVAANDHCTALVPYWAVWPFETLVVFHRHMAALTALTTAEVAGLADILRRLTTRYDNLFEVSFPYSMGFHPAPADGADHPAWHLHAHFYPPLLRSATVRKFMVGYELLAMPQRDLTPEMAADRLRGLSEVHYRSAP
jgi:UDPglucose--hexose-1-phosphate uridylyltransferase